MTYIYDLVNVAPVMIMFVLGPIIFIIHVLPSLSQQNNQPPSHFVFIIK